MGNKDRSRDGYSVPFRCALLWCRCPSRRLGRQAARALDQRIQSTLLSRLPCRRRNFRGFRLDFLEQEALTVRDVLNYLFVPRLLWIFVVLRVFLIFLVLLIFWILLLLYVLLLLWIFLVLRVLLIFLSF